MRGVWSRLYDDGQVRVEQWHERDRHHVSVVDPSGQETYAEWWDDEVPAMVEDGFFRRGRLPGSGVDPLSVIEHLDYHRFTPPGASRANRPPLLFPDIGQRLNPASADPYARCPLCDGTGLSAGTQGRLAW